MKYFTIILILLTKTGFSQHFKTKCDGENVSYRNGGLNHFKPIIHCPYTEVELGNDSLIPEFIEKLNEENLKDKLGDEFIKNNLVRRNKIIVELGRYKEIKEDKRWISEELCNCKIKYAFQYSFEIYDGINYYFTTVYDSLGKELLKNPIPDIKKNKGVIYLVDICEAKKIAEKDNKFKGELVSITIEYNQKLNRFVWLAEKPEIFKGKNKRIVCSRFLEIDAIEGKIINRIVEQGYVVCRMPTYNW